MLKFAVDENFHNDVWRGLLRRCPALDIVRVQDVGLASADDPSVLAWCAQEGRVLITHDVTTMTAFAYERIARGDSMPGVVESSPFVPVRTAIDQILLLAECSSEGEWEGQVVYLPL